MADVFSKSKRSAVMRAIKGKNSKIEVLLRKALWKKGFRYRLNSPRYFGTPDIVLKKYRTVIFVDSCFWHGCARHFRLPAVRVAFWRDKIQANRARDRKVTLAYRRRGWTIFRFWEHDIKRDINKLVERLEVRREMWEKEINAASQNRQSRPGARSHQTNT